MKSLLFQIFPFLMAVCALAQRKIEFQNNCNQRLFITPYKNQNYADLYNSNLKPLIPNSILDISGGGSASFAVDSTGWVGWFTAKFGCDGNGYNCSSGDETGYEYQGIKYSYPAYANTKISFWLIDSYTSYNVETEWGFYTSVKITPTKKSSYLDCPLVQFTAFDCSKNETLVFGTQELKESVNLLIPGTLQCLSPCAYIMSSPAWKYYVNDTDTDYKDYYATYYRYCCSVDDTKCKLRDTNYAKKYLADQTNSKTIKFTPSDFKCNLCDNLASYKVQLSCPNAPKLAG